MIRPKVDKPSKRVERMSYEAATRRDNGQCVRCGSTADVQRDHRKGRGVGGLTTAANLQCLCLQCHLWKTDHPEDANRLGWGVPGWANPSEYPAARPIDGRLEYVYHYDGPDVDGTWFRVITFAEAAEFFALNYHESEVT